MRQAGTQKGTAGRVTPLTLLISALVAGWGVGGWPPVALAQTQSETGGQSDEAKSHDPSTRGAGTRSNVRRPVARPRPPTRPSLTSTPAGEIVHVRMGPRALRGPQGASFAARSNLQCTTPCELSVPTGRHWFALSRPDDDALPAGRLRVGRDTETVHVARTDRSGMRRTGWTVFGISAVAFPLSFVLLTIGGGGNETCGDDCYEQYRNKNTVAVSGIAVSVVGLFVGLILATEDDSAKASVSDDLAHAAPKRVRSGTSRADSVKFAAGHKPMSLSLRF